MSNLQKNLKSTLLVFLPLLWIPILLAEPSFFLKHGRANETTLYALYCNYASEVVLTAIILGLVFSLFQIYKVQSKFKYVLLMMILLSIPLQYIFYIGAHTQAFGK